jgi:hypothetical protein
MVPRNHHYSVGLIELFISFVLHARAALRCAAQIFGLLQDRLKLSLGSPHWSTGRLWMLRLGYYKLTRPKERSDDWVWFIDHSNQIGKEKCLLVLGIRLSQLPEQGECLRHEHLEPIDLIPVRQSNKQIVYEQLEATVAKTGVPRAIVKDDGGDLTGGVALFCQSHPETCGIHDIKHKVARMLKRRLEKHPRWGTFTGRAAQIKSQLQLTDVAFLVPPNQRSKARYMNLDELVGWGYQTLEILDRPPAAVLRYCTAQRLEQQFGWLREYREALTEWSEALAVTGAVEQFVRTQGLYHGASEELAEILNPLARNDHTRSLRDELIAFVDGESSKARAGERLPGSTEVLESCFGKLKFLEGDQRRSGFTGLVLSVGAIVSKTTTEVVQKALEMTKTRDVLQWCQEQLGETVQSKRKHAYKPP